MSAPLSGLLTTDPVVATAGVSLFADAVRGQAVEVTETDWQPPLEGSEGNLAKVMADARRADANALAAFGTAAPLLRVRAWRSPDRARMLPQRGGTPMNVVPMLCSDVRSIASHLLSFSSASQPDADPDVIAAARNDRCVLLTGAAAQASALALKIHNLSGWRWGPFVAVDCGGTEAVLERQLFDLLRVGPRGGAPVPSIIVMLRITIRSNGPSPSPARRSGEGVRRTGSCA